MSTLVAKLLFPFSMILALVSGVINPSYIQLGAESLVFDYKTGDSRPLYFLNVKNIGQQKARFDITSNVDWIFMTQEGLDNTKSIQLDVENSVNFVLDIRTDLVANGQQLGEIIIDAVRLEDKTILETQKVSITLNKNFVPTPTPIPSISETPTDTPVSTATEIPLITTQISPVVSVAPTQTPSKTLMPTVRVSPSASVKAEPIKLVSPSASPETGKQTEMPEETKKSIWRIITGWLSKIF